MTRDQFSAGFSQRLRFVLQKHERICVGIAIERGGETTRTQHDRLMLEAAVGEFSDFVFDALDEKAPLFPAG